MSRKIIDTIDAETETENVDGAVGGEDDTIDVDDSSRMSLGEMLTSGKLSDHKDKHKVREMPANKSGKGPTVTIEKMDRLLEFCFNCAINSLNQKDLPVQASTFYGTNMMSYCPAGESLDVKKSSFKKLPKFIKKQEKTGVIKLKELSKGVESIVRVDNTHPKLQDFQVPDVVEKKPDANNNAEKQPLSGGPVVTELFEITADVLPLFEGLGYCEGSILKKVDATKRVTNFVRQNGLDPEDSKRLLKKMIPVYEIRLEGQPPVVKKGNIEPIKVDVIERAPDKLITVIDNLDDFGIDLEEFSDTVQERFACGASVTLSRDENKRPHVIAQGNKTDCVRDMLLGDYKIPRKYLHIVVHDEYEIVPKVIPKAEVIEDRKRQRALRNCLRITGVKESHGQDTDKIVLDIATAVNVNMSKDDIDWSDRKGKARYGHHRDIIVAFTSMVSHKRLFKKRFNLRKLEDSRWKNVYINEDLTENRNKLLFHARQYRRANLIKSTFSSGGDIYVVDLGGKKHKIIDSEELTVFGVLDPPIQK